MNKIKQNANKILLRSIKTCIALLLMFACVLSSSQVVLAQVISDISAAVNVVGLNASVNNADKNSSNNLQNTYVLNVATGATAGKRVLYFTVKYRDTNNQSFTHYVLLSDEELQKMYSGVANLSSEYKLSENNSDTIKQRISKVESATGYALLNSNTSIGSNVQPLSSMGNDSFLIKTETPIAEVEEIDFFVSTGSKAEKDKEAKDKENGIINSAIKNEWTCNDIRLYKVDKLYGLDMYGYYSNKYFLKFDGTEIASMQSDNGKKDYSWSVDKIIRIKKEKSEGVSLKTGQNTQYSNATPRKVFFELGIEDNANAGIESLVTSGMANEKTISTMNVAESLVLTIEYFDIFENMRRVEMPYITSSAAWANSEFKAAANENIIGLAQQGESLGFVASLPDFVSLSSYKFDYGDAKVKELGLSPSKTTKHDARIRKQKEIEDNLNLAYFAAYDAESASPYAKVINGSLKCSANGSPQLYYALANESLMLGSKVSHEFKEFRQGTNLEPKDYSNIYLVTIKTDNIRSAATTSKISMQLDYTNTSGIVTSTQEYDLSELVSSYYGYWPDAGNDIAYNASVAPGAELNVLISLNDVESFEAVTFTADGYVLDDWQISNFKISKVSQISKRGVRWKNLQVGVNVVDRIFYRDVTSEVLVNCETTVYVKGNGTSTELSLVSKNVTEVEDDNWLDDRYSMTFEQANKNLGFTRTRNVYTVNVKVGNEKNISLSNDDCGSKNLFYFQLIFKGGRSGYVLANQQITSDGFRAGVTESFSIYTNQNYGELVSINIIPDDLSSNNDIFDKLKIDNITVTKESTGGLSRQWVVNNVGWIFIDYHDDGESSRKTGRPARSEAEVARNYAITSKSFVMNLLFGLTTSINSDDVAVDTAAGDTIDEDNNVLDKYGNIKGKKFAQFEGTMLAEISYENGAGEAKKMTVDIVKEMYNYAYLQPKFDSKNSVAAANGQDSSALSDPSFMFKANHTNRFIVTIDDISRIESIAFYATSVGTTTWFVDNVSVSLIDSDGTLGINSNDEYERSGKSRVVATSVVNDKTYDLFCTKDLRQQLIMKFNPNEIKVEKIDEDTWSAAVTREPTTTNDVLNVYIYTSKIARDSENLKLKTYVKFTDTEKQKHQTSSGDMYKMAGVGDGEYVYYAMGLSAKNLATLDFLGVHANANKTLTNYAKYAIIERVRSGVMIKTYRVDFPSHISDLDLLKEPNTEAVDAAPSETQAVTIKLGQNTEKNSLIKMNKDLAVAISYTTTISARETSYLSPYKYVTDEQYYTLMAGDTVTVNFKQPYLKEITGIKLVTTGGMKVPVESAYAASYIANDETEGVNKLTGWYSFAFNEPFVVTALSDTIAPTSKGLDTKDFISSLDIKLVGGKPADSMGILGTTQRLDANPIRVIVGYVDYEGVFVEAKFDDIRKHMRATKAVTVAEPKEGENAADKVIPDELLASVMLRGVKSISWIRLEPYDDVTENIVSVYVNEVTLTHNTPKGVKTSTNIIGSRNLIFEGQKPLFQTGFQDVRITIEGTSINATNYEEEAFKTVNENISLNVASHRDFIFKPVISGSLNTISVDCKKKEGNIITDAKGLLSVANGTYTFKPEAIETNAVYIISIYPTEQLDSVVSITLNVSPFNDKVSVILDGSYTHVLGEETSYHLENSSASIHMASESIITLKPTITNSLHGYKVICVKNTPSGDIEQQLTNDNGTYSFKIPLNKTNNSVRYSIKFLSKENVLKWSGVDINVPPTSSDYIKIKVDGTYFSSVENKEVSFSTLNSRLALTPKLGTDVKFKVEVLGVEGEDIPVVSVEKLRNEPITILTPVDGVYTLPISSTYYPYYNINISSGTNNNNNVLIHVEPYEGVAEKTKKYTAYIYTKSATVPTELPPITVNLIYFRTNYNETASRVTKITGDGSAENPIIYEAELWAGAGEISDEYFIDRFSLQSSKGFENQELDKVVLKCDDGTVYNYSIPPYSGIYSAIDLIKN